MKIKTSELTGTALDWAVAKAEGSNPSITPALAVQGYSRPAYPSLPDTHNEQMRSRVPYYSANWDQGGPIIERHIYRLEDYGDAWEAEAEQGIRCRGQSPLIASMRAYVACKLGDEIDVPDEL